MTRRIAFLLCLLGGVAAAHPPTFARARRVAKAWIGAARQGRPPNGSRADIVITTSTGEDCDGTWHLDHLEVAVRCIAKAIRSQKRPRDWGSFLVDGDTRTLDASIDDEYCQWAVFITVDAAGKVTEVKVSLESCEF